jgi:hypothetical protein
MRTAAITFAATALATALSLPLKAQSMRFEVQDGYNHHGVDFPDGYVHHIAAELERGPWTFSITEDHLRDAGRNEAGIAMNYSAEKGKFTLTTGVAIMQYPSFSDAYVGELKARVERDNPLKPSLEVLQQCNVMNGTAAELSLNPHTIFADVMPISGRITLGYNRHYIRAETGLSHAEAEIEIGIPIIPKRLSLPLSVGYTKGLQASVGSGLNLMLGVEYQFKQ